MGMLSYRWCWNDGGQMSVWYRLQYHALLRQRGE